MSEWFRRLIKKKSKIETLCQICGGNQMPEHPTTLRLTVQDGVPEMLVCDECADFFDKSADVLLKGQKNEQPI
jgi:ribosome-binding protein aMBF1 (putative translation factor)